MEPATLRFTAGFPSASFSPCFKLASPLETDCPTKLYRRFQSLKIHKWTFLNYIECLHWHVQALNLRNIWSGTATKEAATFLSLNYLSCDMHTNNLRQDLGRRRKNPLRHKDVNEGERGFTWPTLWKLKRLENRRPTTLNRIKFSDQRILNPEKYERLCWVTNMGN